MPRTLSLQLRAAGVATAIVITTVADSDPATITWGVAELTTMDVVAKMLREWR
jgi:hypothetical protein